MVRIPFLSVAVNGWQLASRGYAGHHKNYRIKQQWRSFFAALIHPGIASRWFETLKSPELILVARYRPRLYFKPLRVYMSIKWTTEQKIKVILDTYRFIMSKGEAFQEVITNSNGIEIARWQLSDSIEATLKLGYHHMHRKEGELVLFFESEQLGGTIATIAFSFEEMAPDNWVCRIACIQGRTVNESDVTKQVQKLLHGIRPKSFMVFAVQELSRQLGFTAVYGVGDAIHPYRRQHTIHLHWIHAIQFDYDAFWSESGGIANPDHWYELPLRMVQKDIQEIKTNKRSLYTRRYRLLDDLSLKIADSVKKLIAQ